MEFWNVEQPTQTLTYTLTISAPVLPEDWLAPVEHSSSSSNNEPGEELGAIAVTIDKNGSQSPWNLLQNYTSTSETWSRRAHVRRARKNNSKAQAVGSVGSVVGNQALPTPSTLQENVSELYRVLQPNVDGLSSPQPTSGSTAQITSDTRLMDQVTTAGSTKSTPQVTNDTVPPPQVVVVGSNRSSWPAGSEPQTTSTGSNRSTTLQPYDCRLNGPISQVTTAGSDRTTPQVTSNGPNSSIPLIKSTESTPGVTTAGPNGLIAPQATTPGPNGLISPQATTPGPSGSVSQAVEAGCGESKSSPIYSSSTVPELHIVNEDVISATLLLVNADSALSDCASDEVEIIKVHNDLLSVAKEEDVVAMEESEAVEGAVISKEKSSGEEEIAVTREDSVSTLDTETMEKEERNATTEERAIQSAVVKEEEEQANNNDITKEDTPTVREDLTEEDTPTVREDLTKEDTPTVRDDVTKEDTPTVGNDAHVTKEDTPTVRDDITKEDIASFKDESDSKGKEVERTVIHTVSQMTTPTPTSPVPSSATPMPTSPKSTTTTVNSTAAGLLPMGETPPTSTPITMFQNNMTYVPFISNNHLYLYPVTADFLAGHTSPPQKSTHRPVVTTPTIPADKTQRIPQSQQQNQFPNPRAINRFKIPKRRRKPKSLPSQHPHPLVASPASPVSPSSQVRQGVSSEDAVAKSLCLHRQRAGLPVNPFTLTYTITSSSGHLWTTNNLEGERMQL